MTYYDIFNGDADGICALLQWRHAHPVDSQLITGVKRDIKLVQQVKAEAGDELTVLDISFDKNRDAVLANLDSGATVRYVDHHFAGEIPQHAALTTHINTAADVCTALIVNSLLKNAYTAWAVVGAFGDNLDNSAAAVAKPLQLSEAQLQQLQALGIYINYNGYGPSLDDLHFAPADLYQQLRPYANPFDFIRDGQAVFAQLEQGYQQDMQAARELQPECSDAQHAVFILPDAPWARRVSGVFSNELANAFPERAHAVLTTKADGQYLVSVRAPLANKTGADELCRQFATGGGRAAAAGINELPADQVPLFITRLRDQYCS